MIQANELRIGNWVLDANNVYKCIHAVSEGFIDGLVNFENDIRRRDEFQTELNWSKIQEIEPIPLTEEVLLKCGFKYERAISSFTHPEMDMWLSLDYNSEKHIMYPTDEQRLQRQERLMNKFRTGEGLVPTAEAEYIMSNVRIKHLHQLQNLYFALTGKELEVKV